MVVVLVAISVIIASVSVWLMIKTRLELRRLRRVVRQQALTLLRIHSLDSCANRAAVVQSWEQRVPSEASEPEVAESPGGQWPSLETL